MWDRPCGLADAGKVGKYFELPYAYPDWDTACSAFRAWSEKTTPDLADAQWMERARATFVETQGGRVRFDFDPKMAGSLSRTHQSAA